MKRFKLIFHISYILIALGVLYFSIDVLANTEDYLSKIKLSAYIKFPRYIMIAFLVISLIMLTEYILERVNVHQIKEGVEDLEHEIVKLKAKLYDKSQDEEGEDEVDEEVLASEDEEDDDD